MLLPTITRDRLCVLQCQSVSELTSSLECNPLSRNVKKKNLRLFSSFNHYAKKYRLKIFARIKPMFRR